ncbi:HNH endonuclease [Mucilaginibacter sp. OK283]|uniref:HNH endonuclease n=1 Tax=Mucilaginibacter sp. OK283 TaxID=1881049 RepID=UPI0008BF2166|nr:HNH endonuclease [Mucilaginibacter sp. OK283]SEP36801.1 HNH endonuclease [Mucilaginibacter sp. OK283]
MYGFWENKYINTYYYSNVIDNILTGDVELIGFISDFFNDNYEFLKPFQKFSALHQFIQYIIFRFLYEDMTNHDEKVFELFKIDGKLPRLYAERLLDEYGIGYSFDEFEETAPINYLKIERYHDDLMLAGYLEELCEKISHEVFYILFNNRDLLIRFNQIVADHVTGLDGGFFDEEHDCNLGNLFKSPGMLKRVAIPNWCKEAVYFREKGRCCLCGTDITALLRSNNKRHFDHMVPLFYGGINDVSNIQLLCAICNLKKGRKDIETSNFYFKWYE